MALKKGYDVGVSNDSSSKRIFSGLSANKYPTIGKFLPSVFKQQTVFQANDTQQATSQDDEALDLLDRLVNQTLLDRTNPNPNSSTFVSSRAKENLVNSAQVLETQATLETNLEQSESAESIKPAENLATPEMNELSKELQEVSKETKEQREQAEIAAKQQEISNLAALSATPVAVSDKPVVVLPITEKSKEEAKFKSTKYSVRWLIEWCKKVAKIFSGAVVYKEDVDYE